MKPKNWLMVIVLSLIVGSSARGKSLVAPIVIKDKPHDAEKEKRVLEYQSKNIIIIFLIGLVIPGVIVLWIGEEILFVNYFVLTFNLAFKALSLMITVFIPVVIIDSYIVKAKLRKLVVFFTMFGFYALIMFSNLRYWAKEIYKIGSVLEKIDQLEPWILGVGFASLAISAAIGLWPRKEKRGANRLKNYLVKSYGYLVKIGRWDLESVEGGAKKVVPEEYGTAVAEYLAAQITV